MNNKLMPQTTEFVQEDQEHSEQTNTTKLPHPPPTG